MNYDNWRLDNGDNGKEECEHCGDLFEDGTLDEYSFFDADADKQTKFLCEKCIEKIETFGG